MPGKISLVATLIQTFGCFFPLFFVLLQVYPGGFGAQIYSGKAKHNLQSIYYKMMSLLQIQEPSKSSLTFQNETPSTFKAVTCCPPSHANNIQYVLQFFNSVKSLLT